MKARALKLAAHVLCFVPLGLVTADVLLGRIPGEWIKEVTHRTGFWGLIFITASLAVTPVRRWSGWNRLQSYRRMLGLWGFAYIAVHFLIVYLVLDQFFDWASIAKDIVKRPYITVGFTGFVLMIPLALTSTRASIRWLGKKWVPLHSLVYVTALAGVVHFTWSQKADVAVPTRFGVVLAVLLALRLLPVPPPRAATPAVPANGVPG